MRRLMFAHSLQLRLLVVLVVTVAVALGTVALVARASTTAEFTRYVQANRLEMQAVAGQIAATTGERLLVTGPQGRVLLDSSGELVGQQVSPDEIAALGVPPRKAPPLGEGVDVLFVRRTLGAATDSGVWTSPAPAGLPFVPPPGLDSVLVDNREQVFLSAVTRSLGVGVAVGGVVAVVLAFAFSRGVLRPVSALTEAARRMERGDLSQRVEVRSTDEIGQLAHAFNAMADGLARTEQLRRTMVTDVAHELRTPLTNLRGYLEALRDGVTEP